METPEPNKPRKRRRNWRQYSISTLLVVVTIVSVGLGLVTSRAERQRRAVAAMNKLGGDVRVHKFASGTETEAIEFVCPLFTTEKEVAFKLDPVKLSAQGLTVEQLQPVLRGRRFRRGKWGVSVAGKKIDLTKVAKVTVRPLTVWQFTVPLMDGRQAVISPRADRVGRYLVTGGDFESDVRSQLSDPFLEDPATAIVLSEIRVPGGDVPNYWGEDHVHISLGEPLHTFADVEIRGERGPQAADLVRMRQVHKHLDRAWEISVGTGVDAFERRFGPGKVERDRRTKRTYSLGEAELTVHFEDARVDRVYASVGIAFPRPSQDVGPVARARADAERALLVEFLTTLAPALNLEQQESLRRFMSETDQDIQWTEDELARILVQ